MSNERLVQAESNNPAMRKGEIGEAVRLIQQSLIDLGYPMPISTRRHGSPDGSFGSETHDKVDKFQSRNTLGRDGVVGKNTMRKLDMLLRSAGARLPPLPPGTKTRIHHSVPMVAQGPNPICWVACAAMVMSFKQRRAVTIGEINRGFDPSNSSIPNPATTWPLFYSILNDLGFESEGHRMSPDQDFILTLLRAHGPFILTHFTNTFAPAVAGVGTHAIVITGIDLNNGDVFFNNPWGTRNQTTTVVTIQGSMERLWGRGIRSVAYIR
jgi:hypothetical protein